MATAYNPNSNEFIPPWKLKEMEDQLRGQSYEDLTKPIFLEMIWLKNVED